MDKIKLWINKHLYIVVLIVIVGVLGMCSPDDHIEYGELEAVRHTQYMEGKK